MGGTGEDLLIVAALLPLQRPLVLGSFPPESFVGALPRQAVFLLLQLCSDAQLLFCGTPCLLRHLMTKKCLFNILYFI